MSAAWRALIRAGAFVRKEVVEIVRQPRLLLALVLGPFLILLAFGAGVRAEDPPLRAVFVAPPDNPQLAEEVRAYAETQSQRLQVVGVVTDREAALADLRNGDLELVVAFPGAVVETVQANEQAPITVAHDLLDPIETRAIELFTRTAVDDINAQVLGSVVAESQAQAAELEDDLGAAQERAGQLREAAEEGDVAGTVTQAAFLQRDLQVIALSLGPSLGVLGALGGEDPTAGLAARLESASSTLDALVVTAGAAAAGPQIARDAEELEQTLADLGDQLATFSALEPQVIVTPFEGTTEGVGGEVGLPQYYAPAVVVLLLQHLVVTFIALSMAREEEQGTTELFSIAPLRTSERVLGKYLAYLVVGFVLGALLLVGMVYGLDVPMAGSWGDAAIVLVLLLLASLGVGVLFALLARSTGQVVQYAMLLLLASVFFGGFLISTQRLVPVVQAASRALPISHGIDLLRDVMLRGRPLTVAAAWPLAALAGGALVLNAFGLARAGRRR